MQIYILFILSIFGSALAFMLNFITGLTVISMINSIVIYCILLIALTVVNGWIFNIYYIAFFKLKGYKINSCWIYPFFFYIKDKKKDSAKFISFILDIFSSISFENINNEEECNKYERDFRIFLKSLLVMYICFFSIISISISINYLLIGISIWLIGISYLLIHCFGSKKNMGTGIFYSLKDERKFIFNAYKNIRLSGSCDKRIIYSRLMNSIHINKDSDFEDIDIVEQALLDSIYDKRKYLSIEEEEKLNELLLYNIFDRNIDYMISWNNAMCLYAVYIDKFNGGHKYNMLCDSYEKIKNCINKSVILNNISLIQYSINKIEKNYMAIKKKRYENLMLYDKTYFYINICRYKEKIDKEVRGMSYQK